MKNRLRGDKTHRVLSFPPAGVRGRLCRVSLRVQLLPGWEQALQPSSGRNLRVYSRGQRLPLLFRAGRCAPCLLGGVAILPAPINCAGKCVFSTLRAFRASEVQTLLLTRRRKEIISLHLKRSRNPWAGRTPDPTGSMRTPTPQPCSRELSERGMSPPLC